VNPAFPQTGIIPQTNRDVAPRASLSYGINDQNGHPCRLRFVLCAVHNGWHRYAVPGQRYFIRPAFPFQPNQAGCSFSSRPPSRWCSLAGVSTITFADKNFRNPYSSQATLAIERQLWAGLDFTASYAYTRGLALVTSTDVNLSGPSGTATYTHRGCNWRKVSTFTTPIWTAASKINSKFGHVYDVSNGGQSWYSGLSLQLRKRMSHGLPRRWPTLTRTLSTTPSSRVPAPPSPTTNRTPTMANFALDKGTSGTDQRHRFVMNCALGIPPLPAAPAPLPATLLTAGNSLRPPLWLRLFTLRARSVSAATRAQV